MEDLIAYDEIEKNQIFFEKCAKGYRELANRLIRNLSIHLQVEIDSKIPLRTFSKFLQEQNGQMQEWNYFFHGFHCCFTNIKTAQTIEVSLVCGLEFGELDPFFFSMFIKSTPEYHPLPVAIIHDYDDGRRILEKMADLGKFELIQSNWPGRKVYVVSDREKIEVVPCNFLTEGVFYSQPKHQKKRFDLWGFLKTKH